MRMRRVAVEIAPLLVLLAAGAAYLGPALAHGAALGPYDILGTMGLTSHLHASVHNLVASDEIEEFIPWQALAWQQVHAGHLPLWDPYSLLGMPLAFDFQSAPFSLPVVLSYLFPLQLAHTAAVAARILVAGSGAYVLGRVVGLSRTASTLAGTVCELSGGFTIWLGAYEAGVAAFLGWILAASVSLARGRHRARDVTLLALALALALYAGEPQIALVVLAALAVMALALAAGRWRDGDGRAARVCVTDHVLAVVAGVALALPVYLPGIGLALGSSRSTGPYISGLPLYDLTHLLFSSYDGVPTMLGQVIGPDNLYVSMIYVGTVPLALGLLALREARRRAEVAGLVAVTGLVLVALFFSPVVDLASHIEDVRVFRLVLATPLLDFGLAMLAGIGCDSLRERAGERAARTWRWLAAATALLATILAVLGVRLALNVDHLPTSEIHERADSFVWPGAGVLVLAGVVAAHALWARGRGARSRPRPVAGGIGLAAILAFSTASLAVAGGSFVSSSTKAFAPTPAVTELQRDVGSELVGIGSCRVNELPLVGIVPNANAAFHVHELAGFDPIVPTSYAASYGQATGTTTSVLEPPALMCPQITTVRLARLYGVSYVLEPPGLAGPPGTRLVARPGGEGLYAVPRSGRATLVTPAAPTATPTRTSAAATPAGRSAAATSATPVSTTTVVDSSQPTPSSWKVTFDAPRSSVLELRVTDVAGWHATVDGRPLRLSRFDDVMLAARVPAGHDVVRLSYWPGSFTDGLALAAAAVVGLAAADVVAAVRRRRRRARVAP